MILSSFICFTVLAVTALEKMLLAYISIFLIIFKKYLDLLLQVCFSHADGMLLPWQGLAHTCIIHCKVSRQLSDYLSGAHGVGSQPFCVKRVGREEYCCFGKYMGNAKTDFFDTLSIPGYSLESNLVLHLGVCTLLIVTWFFSLCLWMHCVL